MSTNFAHSLVAEFDEMLAPLADVARADDPLTGLRRFLRSCGWHISTPVDPTPIVTAIAGVVDAVDAALDGVDPEDLGDFLSAVDGIRDLVVAVDGLVELIAKGGPATPTDGELAAFGEDVVQRLQVRWLMRKAVIGDIATVIGLIEVVDVPAATVGGWLERRPGRSSRLRPAAITELLADPVGYLQDIVAPNGWAQSTDAAATNLLLSQQLSPLLGRLGGSWRTHPNALATPDDVRSGGRLGVIEIAAPVADDSGRVRFGTELELYSSADTDHAGRHGPAVELAPFGGYEHVFRGDPWTVTIGVMVALGGVDAGDSPPALRISATGIDVSPSVDTRLDVGGHLDLETILGGQGSRFEFGDLDISAFVGVTGGEGDVGFSIVAGSKLVLTAADFGDAVAVVAPFENTIEFDLGLQWSHRGGLRLAGSGSLELVASQGIEIGGVVRLSGLRVRVDLADAIRLSAVTDATVNLGPVATAFESLGLGLMISFPREGGNLGPAAFTLRAEPPAGAAITIDAGAVTGSGFLIFDPVADQYAGGLQLQFEGLTLRAFGLLTTRMPDGSKGFSLLVMVQASGFEPVPLGLGFTLTGVGGLLGVNRTVAVDVLRAGMRTRALDSILFSQDDPTPRAPQIVSTLQSVFPPAPDQYVFGPMVQIAWGPPPNPLLTIEVALILELPTPLRLIVLGRIQASLPTPAQAIIRIRLDVVGVIDFDRRQLAVDATLYDSFVGAFPLSGDMAARGSWGEAPDFAVALGGFHPAFRPPEGFPALRRLALTLSSRDNPRLRMEAYLALTSNTVQIGARLDFYVAAAGFSLEGGFGFDTLITLSPFRLQAEIDAGLTLKQGSTTLAHLGVNVNLVGPAPWEVWGTATLSILSLDISVPFHATFGDLEAVPEPERVDVWPLLKAQLAQPANWATALPPEDNRLATLVAPPGQGDALVHPLGAVSVSQRLVPLERTLTLFGTAPPAEAAFFEITGDSGLVRGEDVYDHFAPAQFRRMSDAEKLSSPSFDRMVSGAAFGPRADEVTTGTVAHAPLAYETALVLDLDNPTRQRSTDYQPPADAVATLAGRGPAALAELRDQGRKKFAAPDPGPSLAEPEYVVATQDTLAAEPDGYDGTYSGAVEALRQRPDAEWFQVVRREELEPSTL